MQAQVLQEIKMKHVYLVALIAGLLLCFIACGADDGNAPVDGDMVEQEPISCRSDRDCITTGDPLHCAQDGFCRRIVCQSQATCRVNDSLNVLPLMNCQEGYCEKAECSTSAGCLFTYNPDNFLEGPFECLDGYCERPWCGPDGECPPYKECINRFCRYCQGSTEDVRLCEDNNVIERRYSRSESCAIILDEEVIIEECSDDERCVEEMIDPPEPEKPYREVYCESLSE